MMAVSKSETFTAENLFDKICGNNITEINAMTLQSALPSESALPFNSETCRLLIALFDTSQKGVISRLDFAPLWKYIEDWKGAFKKIAAENEFSIGVEKLEAALRQYGYLFSGNFLCSLMRKYDRSMSARLHFDDFLHLFLVLHQLTAPFRQRDFDQLGRIRVRFEDYIAMFMSTIL